MNFENFVKQYFERRKSAMKYQKGYAAIRQEQRKARLKENLLFLLGVLCFLVILGLVGAWAR